MATQGIKGDSNTRDDNLGCGRCGRYRRGLGGTRRRCRRRCCGRRCGRGSSRSKRREGLGGGLTTDKEKE